MPFCLTAISRTMDEKKKFFLIRTVRLGLIGTLMKSLNQLYEISPININIIFLYKECRLHSNQGNGEYYSLNRN